MELFVVIVSAKNTHGAYKTDLGHISAPHLDMTDLWWLWFGIGSVLVFMGTGAGIAYGVAKPRYEERVARNRVDVLQVYGTPCYINEGVVMGTQLQRVAAILGQTNVTVETLRVTFMDADLVFVDTPPIGLCGSPQTFWVLDGDASSDLERAVTGKLTRPEEYCGEGAAIGLCTLLVLLLVFVGSLFSCCSGNYLVWRRKRQIVRALADHQRLSVVMPTIYVLPTPARMADSNPEKTEHV